MVFSFFPNLVPRNANPSWFQADKPSIEIHYWYQWTMVLCFSIFQLMKKVNLHN